jgi:hypothetical protein
VVLVVVIVVVAGVAAGILRRKGNGNKSDPLSPLPVFLTKASLSVVSQSIITSYEIGCIYDDTNHALRGASYGAVAMTPQLCAHLCMGFLFYGTEFGHQCYCDNSIHDGYPRVPDSQCSFACGGNSSLQCGGANRLSLYSTSSRETGPSIPKYEALGCYEDNWNRALPDFFKEDSLMTPMLCGGFCQGFTHMGLEYGSQCMCGDSWPANYSREPDRDCNSTCNGNAIVMCGGVWRLDLFLME